MTTTTFVRNPNGNISGTSKMVDLPEISFNDVDAMFGSPDDDAYYEPERGYDGNEYCFTDVDGNVVNLYSRWGMWRVGAHNPEVAERFATWVKSVIGK